MSEKMQVSKGVILKRERERQGISLEAVHEATKIPLDVLRGIEEGYTVRTLTSFYYNGFLKIYARHLGIDIREVVEDYKKEVLPKTTKQDVEDSEIEKWISTQLSNFFTRERQRQIVIVLISVLALFLLVKIVSSFSHRKPSSTVEKTKKAQETNIQKPKSEKPSAKESSREKGVSLKVESKVAAKSMGATGSSSIKRSVTLTVRAKKNTWLKVVADGQVVFQATLKLGAVETWIANEKIEISGKNINQLEFELNGAMIGQLSRKESKAKSLIVTKDGLKVIE